MVRQTWGEPDGMAEGSDVALEAVLNVDGTVDPARVTSSGAITLSVENTVQVFSPLLVDEPCDAFTPGTGRARWNITSLQSGGWPTGTFDGDIKLIDSAGAVTYWPISLKVRSVID